MATNYCHGGVSKRMGTTAKGGNAEMFCNQEVSYDPMTDHTAEERKSEKPREGVDDEIQHCLAFHRLGRLFFL